MSTRHYLKPGSLKLLERIEGIYQEYLEKETEWHVASYYQSRRLLNDMVKTYCEIIRTLALIDKASK